MEALIPVIGKLQDVFATLGHRSNEIELPQIIVVGSQSAGKSSVIEGIVGRDFLPRGTGLVTRCPLLIHLHHTPANSPKRKKSDKLENYDWAEFTHSEILFTDFDEVRKEIEAKTETLCGSNKGITPTPILLHIYSENVVNLSLVDLPGIVKVAIADQPHDIEEQVRTMIVSYIENPKSIILAVTPANQDFATSEPLKLAREVDAEGDRTLGVLTKLDLMDNGTDAMDVLTNKLLPVKLGIIGVVNRSQADINEEKSMQDCRNTETKFLRDYYPSIASSNGIPYLAKTLNRLLIRHIKKCLPELKSEVANQLTRFQATLDLYGEPVTDKGKILLRIINHFAIAYNCSLDGNPKNTSEICGGARICKIFYENYAHCIDKIDAMDGLTSEIILTAILNASGIRPSILIPETAFDLLVKTQIRRFDKPMLQCIEVIHKELARIAYNCGNDVQQEMERFPRLRAEIIGVLNQILLHRVGLTKTFVQEYLNVHLASINTKHPEFREVTKQLLPRKPPLEKEVAVVEEFIKRSNTGEIKDLDTLLADDQALTKSLKKLSVHELTPDEMQDYQLIRKLIPSYFLIIQKQVKDVVPKAIMNFLINYLYDNLHSELIEALYNPKNIEDLMAEDEEVEEKRKDASEMLEALKKATIVLSEINEARV